MMPRFSRHVPTFFKRNFFTQIAHATDLEGVNLFIKNAINSKIIEYRPDSGLHFRRAVGNPHFISGGDVTDRGSYDLELLEILTDFKKRYPENVSLLVGNREIKQCRFRNELDSQNIRERLLHTESPRWINNKTLPQDYVAIEMNRKGWDVTSPEAAKNFVRSLSIEECQLIYLKWMLEKTMGCPHTFRYRREELERLNGRSVSDVEVLRSFLKETEPNGLVGQYLQQAQVGVIVPHTRVLAVHGGLTSNNIGKIPGSDQTFLDAKSWIGAFNHWYKAQIQKWQTATPSSIAVPGNTALDESVLPIPGQQKFIITADMLGPQREFVDIPSSVGHYLSQNGISCLLTGHQPCGDYPAILRNANLLTINGDTGYARSIPSNPDDTRGQAQHLLEINAEPDRTEVSIKGSLSDGTMVTTEFTVTPQAVIGNPYVGKVSADNWLVQCQLPDHTYRLVQQTGFNVKYAVVNEAELLSRLENTPVPKF